MGRFSRLGNDLYGGRVSIDFVGRRLLWYSISAVIVAVAVTGLAWKGLNFGIEFVGGTEYQVTLPAEQVDQDTADELRETVGGLGIQDAEQPVVTTSGTESILIQTEALSRAESDRVIAAITDATGASVDDISLSEIGESWGRDIIERALIGLVVFLAVVVLFIWAYFRQWKMSVAAIVALAHDVVITVGIYSLSGFEVSPATVTGVLTILGFSLYDTVVVFDKVRENTANLRKTRMSYSAAANLAVNQTLVRSINTSVVALLPVGAILYAGVVQLGSGSLKDLALALFVGMAAGAYSSIFIATPLLVQMKGSEKDVQLAERRARARQRKGDRYGAVPAYSDDTPLPQGGGDGRGEDDGERRRAPAAVAPARQPERSGAGRVVPQSSRPVKKSGSSKRVQPSRQSRSRRGRK